MAILFFAVDSCTLFLLSLSLNAHQVLAIFAPGYYPVNRKRKTDGPLYLSNVLSSFKLMLAN